jgi:iron complex outermembrane receptor protein
MNKKLFAVLVTSLAVTTALSSATASAQSRGGVLDEITVTAQKREESAQDVGISITTYSGDQLETFGLQKSSDLAMMTPGVHVGGNVAGQNLQFTIRGVAQNDFNDQTESPVAVYIDDTYVAMAQGQRFAMYDLERVEILKGPQGTLFGRNATGGLAHFVTRRPTKEFEGYGKVEYGDYDRVKFTGVLSGPLSSTVSGRLSAHWAEQDGYLDNHYDPTDPQSFNFSNLALSEGTGTDFGAEENLAVRGQVAIDFSDTMSAWVSANFAKQDISTSPYQSEATAAVMDPFGRQLNAIFQPTNSTAAGFFAGTLAPIPAGLTPLCGGFDRPVPGGDCTGYIDLDGNGLDYTEGDLAFEDHNSVDTASVSAKIEWTRGDIDFVSVTDFKDFQKKIGMDVDSAPMNQLSVWFDADVDQISQEFRMSGSTDRMRWVTGVYYLSVDYDNDIGFKALDNSPLLLPPGVLPADYPAHVEQETDNISVFAQLDYDLSDQLLLTAGVRVMEEEKDFFYQLQVRDLVTAQSFATGQLIGEFGAVVFGQPGLTTFSDSASDTLWAGKVQLDYKPNDDMLLYAGFNRGVKAGGFNSPIDFGGAQTAALAATGGLYPYRYDEEVLNALEVGLKSTFSDGRVRLNGSVYYYDYQDYQGFVFAGVSGTVVNYDSEVVGAEIELAASPTDGLDLVLGVSYIDASVQDVEVAPAIYSAPNVQIEPAITTDAEPSYVPPLQISALARYAWPVGGGEMAAQVNGTYTDETFYTLRNYDSHKMEDYTLANFRLSWMNGDGSWELAGFVNNITDEQNEVMGFDISLFCGCSEIAVGEPRWWGVSLQRNF